jgi:hypothetical protein
MSTKQIIRYICISIVVWSSILHAQTLDPSQTVNPATGEMGFSLPLATIKGQSGNDFTLNLNYKAGITPYQPASTAGLGFDVGAGIIARKVIYTPDDCSGTTELNYNHCEQERWKRIVLTALGIISIIVGVVAACVGAEPVAAALFTVAGFVISGVSLAISLISFGPNDYSAGGTHVAPYNYEKGKNIGFLIDSSGSQYDQPDIYFINTPYLSGEFTWIGDRATGHFMLRNQATTNPATKIEYNLGIHSFKITLADGTRLFFNASDKIIQNQRVTGSANEDDTDCSYVMDYKYTSFVPSQWHLTAVLFPDYIGSDDPLIGTNFGSFVAFKLTFRGLSL